MADIISSLIILAFMVFVFTNEFFQQKMKVAPMPSMSRVRKKMLEYLPEEGKIVELGSGWGGMSILVARNRPNCEVVGYEYSIFPYMFSLIRLKLFNCLPNLRIERKDFFKVDLSNCSAIVCYLTEGILSRLKPKFANELPKSAVVISSSFGIPDTNADEVVLVKGLWNTKIFVYRRVKA